LPGRNRLGIESDTFEKLPRSAKLMGKAMALVSTVADMS
jgi:hypothetical protein